MNQCNPSITRISMLLLFMLILGLPLYKSQAQWIIAGSPGGTVESFAVSGSTIYVGTYAGLYSSTNDGADWKALNTSIGEVRSLLVSGSTVFAGTATQGIFRSTNAGGKWDPANSGIPTGAAIASLESLGSNIFAAADSQVFISTDNGASWSLRSSGISNIRWITNMKAIGSSLLVGTVGGSFLFLSTNEGVSWNVANSGITKGNSITSIGINGNNVFVSTGAGFYVSTNNGSSWTEASTEAISRNMGPFVATGQALFGATTSGVFVSTNNGAHWTDVSTGLVDFDLFVLQIVLSGDKLFAGTDNGNIFKRPVAEMLTATSVSGETSPELLLSYNTPNPFALTSILHYSIPSHDHVRITLSNLPGERIRTLLDEDREAGTHDLIIKADGLPSGVYIVTMTTARGSRSQFICVQK